MKGKVSKPRHKEENTFKFQKFSERIADIKIDVYHRIKHTYEFESEDESYLFQCLDKWRTMNCSESFVSLSKEITTHVKTLPQVIKQKERIVKILLDALENKDPLNLETVLELIVALAKDLQTDFYPFYFEFHFRLLTLLETKDTEQLEWTFHCLAYLFKFLWRCLVSDLQNVFDSFVPLLSSSKPSYIKNFAAESFAFVARKVKDQKKFLKLTLQLSKKSDSVDGCGRLLFEVVKGLKGAFHSCAEQTLSLYLESLADDKIPNKILFPVLKAAHSHMVDGIHPNHSSLIWTTLQETLKKFIASWKDEKCDKNALRVKQLLEIIEICVLYKSGIHLKDVDALINILQNMLQPQNQINAEVTEKIAVIYSSMLLSQNITLTQENASWMILSAMSFLKNGILMKFVENVISYSGFSTSILPKFLDYCATEPVETTMYLLSKIVLHHSPLANTAADLSNWSPCCINISKTKNPDFYFKGLISQLTGSCPFYFTSNIDKVASSIILLCHMKNSDKNKATEKLKSIVALMLKFLKDDCKCDCGSCGSIEEDVTSKALFILSLAIESVVNLKHTCVTTLCDPDVIVNALLPYCNGKHLSALRALDFLVTADETNVLAEYNSKIKESLWKNLLSPFHKIRLFTSHILYELEKGNPDGDGLTLSIYENCWNAESVGVSLGGYREKLKFAQRLEPGGGAGVEKSDIHAPLSLILGMHFINFKLLWAPLTKILVGYAKYFPVEKFWPIFSMQVKLISRAIRDNDQHEFKQIFTDETLVETYESIIKFEDKPDYFNCRILLWNAMKEFPEVCEVRNRDLVSEFMTFLEEEYSKIHADSSDSLDISNTLRIDNNDSTYELDNTGVSMDQEDVDEEGMDVDEDSDNDEGGSQKIPAHKTQLGNESPDEGDDAEDASNLDESGYEERDASAFGSSYKWPTRSLIAHLEVFSTMKNPKALSKENELLQIYTNFLSHNVSDVQKAAFDCIMTYKFKYLLPYKDHLYGLIDDKKFKHEMILFQLNSESNIIRDEHRSDLIPIVMRLVSSKMFGHVSSKSSKDTKQGRKAAVSRFLAGCSPDELQAYLDMAFPLIVNKFKDDPLDMVEHVIASIDFSKTIPPRKLLGSADQLKTLIVYCGGILHPPALARLLKIILVHMCHVVKVTTLKNDVHPRYLRSYKTIRKSCFESIRWFYDKLESYPWALSETIAVFEVFVWPWIDKLTSEGVHSPNSLMKLFSTWSQNPRYFTLLGFHKEGDVEVNPMEKTMKLWLMQKAHSSVSNTILEMVERLLSLIPEDNSAPIVEVPRSVLDHCKITTEEETKFNLGCKLIKCYVESVLEVLRRKLTKTGSMQKRDVDIMSRITEMVSADSSTQTEAVLSLLMPILVKRAGAPEHSIIPLLTSIKNLYDTVTETGQYLRILTPLFFKVNGPIPRKIFTSLVIQSYKNAHSDSDCNKECKLIEDINSYNIKWLDQPDFNRRIDAFRNIDKMISDNSINLDLALIIVNVCFYFINMEKDLSLRDNASQCLKVLCPSLSKAYKDDAHGRQSFIDQTVLKLIMEGIKSRENEYFRNESIVLLGIMVRECSDLHPVLRDLSIFSNKVDLEVDFFENMQHLQMHRRIRAMLKFCELAKGYDTPPTPRALTQFILPIVCHYLCNEKYSVQPTIVDVAVQALHTACRLLPWHQYFSVLKYYLTKFQNRFEFPKQLMKINVEILNAFHFDLSAADEIGLSEITTPKEDASNSLNTTSPEENDLDKSELEEKADNENEFDIDDDDSNEEEVEESSPTPPPSVQASSTAYNKIIVLSKSASNRVITTFSRQLLPQLRRCMTEYTQSESNHKINKRQGGISERDERDMVRIPLAVAIIKLLQKMPREVLNAHASGVILKVVSFLKSRVEPMRKVARETLQEIAIALGPTWLPALIKDLSSVLTKGFHIHVLAFSMNSILNSLKPYYEAGHMDAAVDSILEVCSVELFGDPSEEKEVGQILGRVVEAKSCKSYNAFNIMSTYITEGYMLNLILPLKEELSKTLSHKVIQKISECLRLTVLGLMENKFLSTESLILFAYGTSSESIPSLTSDSKSIPVDPKLEELKLRRPPDSFLIPSEPKRQKPAETKMCAKTNAHLLVEFGLNLLFFLLRRDKLKDAMFRPHLDPLVKLLLDCLRSHHVKVSIIALKCLVWVMKFDLPSLRKHIGDLTSEYFAILHKYAAAGLSKGDNFDLVLVTFKAVAVLVKQVKFHQLDDSQMRILLMYCEQDLNDHSRQATAFSLLKALIVRKVQTPELPAVIDKVAKLSVTADLDTVRLQARQVIHNYLMEYPLGKKISSIIAFYYRQITYEAQSGRESVLAMISSFVASFPADLLKEESGVIFLTLGARLVNEGVPELRKTAADIILELIEKVDSDNRDQLFDIAFQWLQQQKVTHRRLAAQLIGLFVTCEKGSFEKRLGGVLPLFVDQFVMSRNRPGRFVLLNHECESEEVEGVEKMRDHLLFQVLQTLVKIITHIPKTLTLPDHLLHWSHITEHSQILLNHPHEWVRLGSIQLLGLIMSSVTPSTLAESLTKPSPTNDDAPSVDCLYSADPRSRLKSITLDVLAQLIPGNELNEKFLIQCMKLLVYIAEVVKSVSNTGDDEHFCLSWLVRKVRKAVNAEIVQAPLSTTVRTMCFNWIAAISMKLEHGHLSEVAYHLIAPLVREVSLGSEGESDQLQKVAKETLSLVKKKLGLSVFNKAMAQASSKLDIKRAERKKERAQLVVTDPVRAAKRKIHKQQKKKLFKKRKLSSGKSSVKGKKKVKKEVNLEEH